MQRGRIARLLVVAAAASVAALWALAPAQFDRLQGEFEQVVSGLPGPVVVAILAVAFVVVFVATAIAAARALYWVWRKIDGQVLRVVDLILPESPVVRFAVGLVFMILVFLIGPLIVFQTVYVQDDDDDGGDANGEDDADDPPSNETDDGTTNDTAAGTGVGNDHEDGAETNGSDEGDP